MSTDTSSKQCSTRGYNWIHVATTTILSPIHDVDGNKGHKWIQLVSGLHVSGRSKRGISVSVSGFFNLKDIVHGIIVPGFYFRRLCLDRSVTLV